MMKTNRHILSSARLLCAVAALCFLPASCMKEDRTQGGDAFRVDDDCTFVLLDEGEALLTRSVFDGVSGWTDSKKSNVTLAAYCGGTLFAKQYYTSGLTAMTLSLEKGRTYNVYALVNMGDMTSSVPDNENGSGGIASLVYTIPSYNSGSNSVAQYGIPMAGVLSGLSVTASTTGTQHVPVKRLLARVTLNLTCNWPGAQIRTAKVYNLNRRLVPFGDSAAQSSSDILPGFQELTTASSPGSTLTAVMYVPENLQGNLGNASSSANKRPDAGISAITSRQAMLSYMEVYAEGASPLSGSVKYRSYLGSNATSNFDIVRNTRYVWNVTYQANGLQTDNWKVDSDLSDDRRIVLNGPFFAERNESFGWSSVVNSGSGQTNIGLADIAYSFTGLGGQQASAFVQTTSGTMSSSGSFTMRSTAPVGSSVRLTATPASNPNNIITGAAISAQTQFNVIDRVVEWKEYDASVYASENRKVYVVDPGSSVTAEVDFSYTWNGIQTFERGQQGSKWTYTTPSTGSSATNNRITSSYTAGSGNTRDRVTYTVGSNVSYGDYAMTVDRVSPMTGSDQAYVRVADSRYLRWVDRSSIVSGNSNILRYEYTSPGEVHLYVKRTMTGSQLSTLLSTAATNPLVFNFGDATGEHHLRGTNVTASNFNTYMARTIPNRLTWNNPTVGDSESRLNITTSGSSSIGSTDIPFRLRFSGEAQGTGHEIVLTIHPSDDISYVLVASPATLSLAVGGIGNVSANVYRVVNGTRESSPYVSNVGASWTSSASGVASVTGATVTGVAQGTAYLSASYTYVDGNSVSHQLTTTGSDRCAVTVQNVVQRYLEVSPASALGVPVISAQTGQQTVVSFTARLHTVTNGVDDGGVDVTTASGTSWVRNTGSTYVSINNSGSTKGQVSCATSVTTTQNATLRVSHTVSGETLSATAAVSFEPVVTHYLEVTPATSTADIGQTVTLSARYHSVYNGVNDTYTDVTTNSGTSWSRQSGSTSVSVSNSGSGKGRVTCASSVNITTQQSAVIGATYEGETATANVTFRPVFDYVLVANPTARDIFVGGTTTVSADIYRIVNGTRESAPFSQNVNASWSVASETSPGVASVTGYGTASVTGLSAGTAVLTASYSFRSPENIPYFLDTTGNDRCTVTVRNDSVVSYDAPVLVLTYSPNPIPASGGTASTATPTLTYTQVAHYASGNTVTLSGTLASGGTPTSGVTWSGSAGGFTLDGTNGEVTASQNTGSRRSILVTATVQNLNGYTNRSVQALVEQDAGTGPSVTTYRYELVFTNPSGSTASNRTRLGVGYDATLAVQLKTTPVTNGVDGTPTYTNVSNVQVAWGTSSSNYATVSAAGVVHGVAVGDVDITANYTVQANNQLGTPATPVSATAYLRIVGGGSGGGWMDDWNTGTIGY